MAEAQLEEFRQETRAWLEENCPPGARGPGPISNGSTKIVIEDADTRLWLERMVEKGWTVPNWPTEYGGGGLSKDEYVVLLQEMGRIGARPVSYTHLTLPTTIKPCGGGWCGGGG